MQRSKAPLKKLAAQYGLNHKTVAKWRKRAFVNDAPMGPKAPRSTVLSPEEEAIVIAFRKHTLPPLDGCLYALRVTIPNLTRSSQHRCLKRHGISRLPEIADDKALKKPFKHYQIGYFHIDFAEVRTGEGMGAPIIQDQQLDASELVDQPREATVDSMVCRHRKLNAS